jgi:hypothetical protein
MVFSVYAAGRGPREAYAVLDLPATPYEIEDALEKVRLQPDEELLLEIEEYYDFGFLAPYLEDVNDLHGLNALAQRLSQFVDYESAVFAGQLKMDLEARISDITLPRLLSLANNTPYCDVVDVAVNDSQLGKFYAENGFVTELEQLPDEAFKIIEDMLDYEQIGRKMRQAEGGVFVDRSTYGYSGYVIRHKEPELINALPAPEKPDYMILLEVCKGYFNDPDYDSDSVVQLKLPASKETLDGALNTLEAADWSELAFTCLDCRIPALIEAVNQTEDVFAVNHAASRFAKMTGEAIPKLKSLLEVTGISSLADAVRLTEQLESYVYSPEFSSPTDVARAEIKFSLIEQEADLLIPHVNLHQYGKALLENHNWTLTDYGMISRQDGQPIQKFEEQNQGMGGMCL